VNHILPFLPFVYLDEEDGENIQDSGMVYILGDGVK